MTLHLFSVDRRIGWGWERDRGCGARIGDSFVAPPLTNPPERISNKGPRNHCLPPGSGADASTSVRLFPLCTGQPRLSLLILAWAGRLLHPDHDGERDGAARP